MDGSWSSRFDLTYKADLDDPWAPNEIMEGWVGDAMGTQRLPWSSSLALVYLLALTMPCVSGCEKCAECRDEKCSDLVDYCSSDPDCGCMAECLGEEGIPGVEGCLGSCGLTERPPRFAAVEECVAVACPDSDECSTPEDWTLPDDDPPDLPIGDIGGGDLADCAFEDDLSFDPSGDVLQLQNADRSVCVRIERLNAGSGSLANTEWILLDIWVGPLGSVAHVDAPDDICWYSSHHNFADWAHVWTGSRLHGVHLQEDGHGGAWTYELHTFEEGELDTDSCPPIADGVGPIGGPIELFPFDP